MRDILYAAYDCPISEHFSFIKTLYRLSSFHWKHKVRDVKNYCNGCQRCQQSKNSRQKPLGSPQPLEVPSRRWGSLATDFITHLPKTSRGFDAITTYVDRFSKRVRFIPSKGSDTAMEAAADFYEHIFRLHGLPNCIVSDRDPKFTSKFWSSLMDLCGVKIRISTSHHPQTDGASEIMNRMVENYLRCYCDHQQDEWDRLLISAEFAYNSANMEGSGACPFELDLGWKPRSLLNLLSKSDCKVESLEEFRLRLSESYKDAKFAQEVAQARSAAYNAKRYTTTD